MYEYMKAEYGNDDNDTEYISPNLKKYVYLQKS